MDTLTLERHNMLVVDGCFLLLWKLKCINALWEEQGEKMIEKLNMTTAAFLAKYWMSILVVEWSIW